jgi:cell wall-associated NlpC family hydrolase
MLPRDARDQAGIGQAIEFANEAKPGDLAFFDDENGVISHVGIVAEDASIIHCSGFVRVDRLDHQGIFNLETHRYTHKLRIIRRVIFD